MYIISDLLIWSAYFSIPVVIIRFIKRKQGIEFVRLYFLFAAFILACGATHFLDALAFWVPAYRLNALVRLITGVISWITVFYLIKYLPALFSLKTQRELAGEIEQRKIAEEKFRGLLEAAPDAMIITNETGGIQLVNRQTEVLFGYTRTELIGKPVEILIPAEFHHKHVEHRTGYFTDPKARSVGNGLTLYGVRKDTTRLPVEISLAPLVIEGSTLITASVRDISARIEEEEKLKKANKDFQLLVRSVKDYAIFMLDTNGRITSWNNGAENIKGYKEDEIIGQPLDIFYPAAEKQRGEPQKNLQMALQSGHYETEGWRVRKDGSLFYANVVFRALHDDEGVLYGYAKVTKDITEKRKYEERIGFLASITANIQDPVICSDNNFIITRWNEAAEKLLEWKSDEAIGKSTIEILKIIYPHRTREEIIETFKEKGFWQGELIFHTKSGRPVNVLSTSSLLKDTEGNITGNLVLIRDITERKKAEDALSKLNAELEQRVKERTEEIIKNENRFQALVENNYDIISLLDESLNIIYRSPSATRIMGWTNEEAKELPGIQNVHPDDREDMQQIIEETMTSPDKPVHALFRRKHKDGHYVWLEGMMTNLLHDEQVKAIVTNFRDVTEKIESHEKIIKSEKLYRNLFENMLHGFAYCKGIFEQGRLTDYRYLNVNSEYELLTGLKDITGKKVSEVMPGLLESDPVYAEIVGKVALSGNPAKFETYVAAMDKWFSISLYSPDRGYFVGLIDNITERKQTEQKIKKINLELEETVSKRTEELRKTNKELEDFSYSISHDLRAPLRIIDGFGQILLEDHLETLDEEGQKNIQVIMKSARKMGRLIDDLLNFSKSGKSEIRMSVVDMNELVKEVLSELRTSGIVIPANFKLNKLRAAKGDANLLVQVWTNLISNAIKYSGAKENPVIEIGTIEKNDKCIYYVKDNGAGFDMQYADKLFGVFQRLHREEEFAGTGVGLALVQRIIFRHGGSIWAEAKENEGAVFYFTLPE
jgi:PAS domain S-box-containing protein